MLLLHLLNRIRQLFFGSTNDMAAAAVVYPLHHPSPENLQPYLPFPPEYTDVWEII